MARKKKAESVQAPEKRNYASPTERVMNNVSAMQGAADLALKRLKGWENYLPDGSKKDRSKLVGFVELLSTLQESLSDMHSDLTDFFTSFTPPERPKKLEIQAGDMVKIRSKFRSRYEKVFANANLDQLLIEEMGAEDDGRSLIAVDSASGTRVLIQAKAHVVHTREIDLDDEE